MSLRVPCGPESDDAIDLFTANEAGELVPGDVVDLNVPIFWRGGPCNLRVDGDRAYMRDQGGEVLLSISTSDKQDPLGKLTNGELASLAGVELWWPGPNLHRLEHVDFERACLSVQSVRSLPLAPENIFRTPCLSVDADVDGKNAAIFSKFENLVVLVIGVNTNSPDSILRALPNRTLQTLVLDQSLEDAELLREFTSLQVLRENSLEPPLRLAFLTSLPDLLVLNLTGVEGLSALRGLSRLRQLGLWVEHHESLEPLASLRSLTSLSVRGEVDDLSPIASLRHLAHVNANFSQVARLPDATLPALRKISLLSTPVSAAAAEAFIKRNPQAVVDYRYEQRLRRFVGTAVAAPAWQLKRTTRRDGCLALSPEHLVMILRGGSERAREDVGSADDAVPRHSHLPGTSMGGHSADCCT